MARKTPKRGLYQLRSQVYAVAQSIQQRTGVPPETVHVTPEQLRDWQDAGWPTVLPNGTRLSSFDEQEALRS